MSLQYIKMKKDININLLALDYLYKNVQIFPQEWAICIHGSHFEGTGQIYVGSIRGPQALASVNLA